MGRKPEDEPLVNVALMSPDCAVEETESIRNDELMESIAHGNTFAFESFYNRFSGLVYCCPISPELLEPTMKIHYDKIAKNTAERSPL